MGYIETMSLLPGTKLGNHEILSPLGAGGMGEVYRARDTKLGRDVAIKILPDEFSEDAERLSRFEQEGKLLAALNHPNIATLYGLEESHGQQYLVMELVEGDTLAERIAKGPIATKELLALFRQIALGLEAAHDKGIVHRDLKPANIKITPEGNVKILDFGLAKPRQEQGPGLDASQSPTLTKATAFGTVMGTASYMSPEQARGNAVDKRTDIWAYGCCLYESLTATSAFAGETVADVISAVLGTEPDWSALPAELPTRIRTLLSRCLRKKENERLRDIGDARIEIDDWTQNPASDGVMATGSAAEHHWLLAAALLLAVVATFYLARRTTPLARSMSTAARFTITLPQSHGFPINRSTFFFALSPDGSRLVYAAFSQGSQQELFVRDIDAFDAHRIPGTEEAEAPFFSPDGRWVGFFTGNEIRKVPISGGPPVTITSTPVMDRASADWSEDDRIVFSSGINSTGGLQSVDAAGGTPEPLAKPDMNEGEFWHALPQVLPGGKSVIFTISTTGGPRLAALDLETREQRIFDEIGDAVGARYTVPGHLLYSQSGTLMTVPFDASRLELRGEPRAILDGVHTSLGMAFFSTSNGGALAFLPGDMIGNKPVLVDRTGHAERITDERSTFQHPRFSPDGRRLVVDVHSASNRDIWVYDLPRGTRTRLTTEGFNLDPLWTPDGERIAFRSHRGGAGDLYWMLADGSGVPQLVHSDDTIKVPGSWSPAAERLAFTTSPGREQWILDFTDGNSVSQLFPTEQAAGFPAFSPGGRFVAYVSDESGRDEIYVRAYPGPAGKWPVSVDGGREPLWARNGRELFYRNRDAMMAVAVTTEPSFSAEEPRQLFRGNYDASDNGHQHFDVSPDGATFAMIGLSEDAAPTGEIRIILDWRPELEPRLAPEN